MVMTSLRTKVRFALVTSLGALLAAGCGKGRYRDQLAFETIRLADPISSPPDSNPPSADVLLGDRVFHGREGGGTCFTCHGVNGTGTDLGPDLTDRVWIQTDGSKKGIAGLVRYGVPTPREHSDPMPPEGGAHLTDEQIEAVASYVYSLSHPANASHRAVSAPGISRDKANRKPVGDVGLGERIFHGKEADGTCFACHGRDARGTALGPSLRDNYWFDTDGSEAGILEIVRDGVPEPKEHGIIMPAMGGVPLTDEQIQAVAAYVYSLSHTT